METKRTSDVQQRAEALMEEHGFLGVPKETFEAAGRQQLIALLEEGLLPESRVLEFGCGCLRVAYWLVRFLDPGGYCGIEPAWERVLLGRKAFLDPDLVRWKRPRFHRNEDFDSSVFGRSFDFFLARSIWTHASKQQIGLTLDGFRRDSTADGVFLASYLPARTEEEDYRGHEWVGTSHRSDVPGVVRHSLEWIRGACDRRELLLEEVGPTLDCDSQLWLRVRRRSRD